MFKNPMNQHEDDCLTPSFLFLFAERQEQKVGEEGNLKDDNDDQNSINEMADKDF